jgi:hypothetical protein
MSMPYALVLALLSASPGPTPAAARTADVARWVRDLGAVRYGSFALARAMNDFAGNGASGLEPTIRTANAGATIDVCFEPARPLPGCGYHIIAFARDVSPPPSSLARTPTRSGLAKIPLGLTYPQLLARFHADDDFASKNIVRNSAGAVAFVTALDEDPPPSRYDHGPQSYVRQEYFFRGGVVAAYAYQESMN